jgi:hypothetical protein
VLVHPRLEIQAEEAVIVAVRPDREDPLALACGGMTFPPDHGPATVVLEPPLDEGQTHDDTVEFRQGRRFRTEKTLH